MMRLHCLVDWHPFRLPAALATLEPYLFTVIVNELL